MQENRYGALDGLDKLWHKVLDTLPEHPFRKKTDTRYVYAIDCGYGEEVAQVFEAAAELLDD